MRILILLAALSTLPTTIAATLPNPPTSITATDTSINPRDIPPEEQVGYLIFSNGCLPNGSGFPHCRDMYTMKWGPEGEYESCHDQPVSFRSECDDDEVDKKIETPMGLGFFAPDVNECESGNRKGIILSRDVNNLFLYECVKDGHQFTEHCGFSWASTAVMKCTLAWK
ncbi:hypothetical protein BJY04DRAFT_217524 [Aspergillus karnatakaensis]|uniref:uncharacterized protein n=1 Tax=Aspergillus karnatakaensis TaxID=1810916 RepID=UPI003CCD93C2